MNKDIRKLLVLIGSFALFISCSTSRVAINTTTHQKFVISESEIETKIQVFISDAPDNVIYEYIVFNRQQVPVMEEDTQSGKMLTAVINNGTRSILPIAQPKIVDLPNQLTYSINGKQDYILLRDIKFLPSKINRM